MRRDGRDAGVSADALSLALNSVNPRKQASMGSLCDPRPRGRARNLRALGAGALGGVAVLAWLAGPVATAGAATTQSFTTPGQYAFTVPAGVTSVSVSAVGGAGGSCNGTTGGEGAAAAGTFAVQPGEQLLVGVAGPGGTCPVGAGAGVGASGVGGGGSGGGSIFPGAGGGGASEVGRGLLPSYSGGGDGVLVVAAGGGGAGANSQGGNADAAGQAGPATTGGGAGTAPGGAAGADLDGGTGNGQAGTFGFGGGGGSVGQGGGGGGGGYYGGGGGAGASNGPGTSGGGGGSSFLAAGATNTSAPTPTTANPSVIITYTPPTPPSEPTATVSMQSLTFTPAQPVGSISPQLTLKVSNTGAAPLVISGVQTGGADPGDFLLDDLCQQPVAPGASCQVGVRFAPQAKGSRTATLSLVSNAPTAPPPVTLAGTGAKGGKHSSGTPGNGASGGQVVCRTGTHGKAICEIECAPATYKIHGASIKAAFSVQRGDRVVAHGRLELKRGIVARHTLRLTPGRYTLVISTGHGEHKDVLVRLPFRAP
jgi:hypothetical protein